MRWPMSWNDTVKAAALAVLAERTTTTGRISVDSPWNWNPHGVWLSRIKPRRERAVQSSAATVSGPPTR
jgi:hypothetical protein